MRGGEGEWESEMMRGKGRGKILEDEAGLKIWFLAKYNIEEDGAFFFFFLQLDEACFWQRTNLVQESAKKSDLAMKMKAKYKSKDKGKTQKNNFIYFTINLKVDA